MAPKKKGQKMDLGSFLMDESTGGSWADEMEALPTGPSGDPSLSGPGGLGGSHLSRGADRYGGGGDRFGDRPARQEIPIPNEPPYTAFAGNLSFETTEGDLEDFFAPLKVTSVRLVMGQDNRPKGFGYVEFESQSDLKEALAKTGADVNGRVIRVGVAEPPKSREGRADDEPTWERKGPLPPQERRGFSSGGFSSGGGGFGSGAAGGPRGGFDEVERDGPIRGGKFVPSAGPPARSGFGGGAGGFGGSREGGFTNREGGFNSNREGGFGRDGGERSFSGGAPEVEREGPIRGGKFVPSEQPAQRSSSFGNRDGPSRADEAGWQRSGPLASAAPARDGPSPQRQKLQLSARSVSASDASATAAPSNKPSPFGAAKPIDTAERERQIEEKLAKDRAAAKATTASAAGPAGGSSSVDAASVVAGSEKTTTTSGVNPFGGAKPINTTVREREVEEKLAASRAESTANSKRRPSAGAAPSASATTAMRKEGFSYAAAGSGQRRPSATATATEAKENGSKAASPSSSPKPKEQKSLISALEETTI